MRVLRELQRAIETVYRLAPDFDIADYVIPEATRCALGLARTPAEQLLLREGEGELEIGLFVDPEALGVLERGLSEANLGEFLLALEGVSHIVYAVARARDGRPFSALELELQAEVDKYLIVLLIVWAASDGPPEELSAALRARLFERVRFHDDLSGDERDRYRTANGAAKDYATSLETRFLRRRALSDLLGEVRRFYRLGCAEKLGHIARKAA